MPRAEEVASDLLHRRSELDVVRRFTVQQRPLNDIPLVPLFAPPHQLALTVHLDPDDLVIRRRRED